MSDQICVILLFKESRFYCAPIMKKNRESAHAMNSNRWYLRMRRRNQNFDKKFEISKKFSIEWYIVILVFHNLHNSFERISLFHAYAINYLPGKNNISKIHLLATYSNRWEIFCCFRICCQNCDFAYAFRDISDSSESCGRIRKLFFTIESQ